MQHRSITLLLLLLVITLFQDTLAQAEEFGTMQTDAKTAWPELVGANGEAAKAKIADATGFLVQVVPDGSMVTMDFREDRVRIFVDASGNVVTPPRVG
jgi:hypothetical protein